MKPNMMSIKMVGIISQKLTNTTSIKMAENSKMNWKKSKNKYKWVQRNCSSHALLPPPFHHINCVCWLTSTASPAASGNNVSMFPISFANLFKTRPDEFLLKNSIGDRVMPRYSQS